MDDGQEQGPESRPTTAVSSGRRRSGLPGALAAVLGVVGLDRRRACRPGAVVGLAAAVVALGMSAFFAHCIGGGARC